MSPTLAGRVFNMKPSGILFICLKIVIEVGILWPNDFNFLKEMEVPEHLTCILRNLYAGQEATVRTGHGTTDEKQQLELDREQQTGSKLGKEYGKAVYFHPAYLTYMQSTSCEMPGWMRHKLESRLPGEI